MRSIFQRFYTDRIFEKGNSLITSAMLSILGYCMELQG